MVGINLAIAASLYGAKLQGNEAADIVKRCSAILGSAKTIQGSYYLSAEGDRRFFGRVKFHLKKDNMIKLSTTSTDDIFDGKNRYVIDRRAKTFDQRDIRIFGVPYVMGFEAFQVSKDVSFGAPLSADNAEMVKFDGRDAVKVSDPIRTLYIEKSTQLPLGFQYSDGAVKYTARFFEIKVDQEIPDSAFEVSSTEGLTEVPVVSAGMIKSGTAAPVVDSPAQKVITEMIGSKEAVVLAFLNRTDPSRELIQNLSAMAGAKKSELGIMAIGNNRDVNRLYRGKLPFPMMIEQDLSSERLALSYGVTEYPAIIVLDKDGIVQHRQVGGSIALVKKALADLGVELP
jgi:outer membrane lipoprotein-sorting protein